MGFFSQYENILNLVRFVGLNSFLKDKKAIFCSFIEVLIMKILQFITNLLINLLSCAKKFLITKNRVPTEMTWILNLEVKLQNF